MFFFTNIIMRNEYNNHSKEERQLKGQFFTPDALIEKMLRVSTVRGTLIDNSMGSGNILAYAIEKKGFKPEEVYGIEFDPEIYDIALERLTKLGVPKENLKLGDALDRKSYLFGSLLNEKSFDIAVINPPYKIGNKVAWEVLNRSKEVVCLMPLSKYKRQKLWSKIVDFGLADPSLFQDANITPNLCITRLVPNPDKDGKFEKETDYQLSSFDPDFKLVYEYNMEHKGEAFTQTMTWSTKDYKSHIESKRWFVLSIRVCENRVHGESAEDYKWNVLKQTDVDFRSLAYFYQLSSEKAKDNLCKWWYYKGKGGLAHQLIEKLNKDSGSCEDAIPQVDWEQIENNEYWKQGDYDSAVLDAMNLKMVEGKVVRKNIQKFETEVDLNLKGYAPELRLVYEYNQEHKGTGFIEHAYFTTMESLLKKGVENKTWFQYSARAQVDGVHTSEDAEDYKWNYKLTENINSHQGFCKMPSEKAKGNLTKWWYYKGKNGLANSLLKGLNKSSGSCEDAIPQVDWEQIENNEYWKNGDYDSAVLDAMNLKMVDGKIIKKKVATFNSEEELNLMSYSSDFRLVYEYNLDHKGTGFINRFAAPNTNKTLEIISTRNITPSDWFIGGIRTVVDGVHTSEDAFDRKWNIEKVIDSENAAQVFFTKMKSEKAKDNLTKWWYYKGKNGLANSLLKGMNKTSGSCEDAIPQIDWEAIENNEYWKQGQYDEAVLDMMGFLGKLRDYI